eukprot:GEMP01018448.1.p1 GENE.GEMP01018448.1~~GEMP01018448.1.p1  ORF type:complete len:386 (+),score=78.78 GEMP01018448.1:1024-2181(+)
MRASCRNKKKYKHTMENTRALEVLRCRTFAMGENAKTNLRMRAWFDATNKKIGVHCFLCPTLLNKQFDDIPDSVKDNAILVFRCARSWMFPRKKREGGHISGMDNEAEKTTKIITHSDLTSDFLLWVLEKEHCGMVFWMKKRRGEAAALSDLSLFLGNLECPIVEKSFNPLILDPYWWRTKFCRRQAKFTANVATITGFLQTSPVKSSGSDTPPRISMPKIILDESSDLPLSKGDAENVSGVVDSDGGGKRGRRRRPRCGKRNTVNNEIPALVLMEILYQSNPTLGVYTSWPFSTSLRCLPPISSISTQKKIKGYIRFQGDGIQVPNNRGDMLRLQLAVHSGPAAMTGRLHDWPHDVNSRMDSLREYWYREDQMAERHRLVQTVR